MGDYYSHSRIKSWRRCKRSHYYKYIMELVRRTAPAALLRGTTFHEMLDAPIQGKDWKEPLIAYREVYEKLWDEEREQYPSPDDLISMYERYQRRWAHDGLDYEGKSEITVLAEHRGMTFKGIIDKLPVDHNGIRFVMDHKTHKVLPDENTRFADLQTVLYYWACLQNGMDVGGVLWDYIRTKPPAIPELLKTGGLSKRSNIDTDYDTYYREIKKHDLNPANYSDILEKVKKNVFFKRVPLPGPSPVLVENVVKDFFDTAEEIRDNPECATRNMTRDCKSCTYFNLCSAEVRGLDTEFIIKQMYVIQPRKEEDVNP